MRLTASGLTDKGKKREWNEDSIFLCENLSLFIVADGMGGHKGGKEASHISTETAKQRIKNLLENETPLSGEKMLLQAFQAASASVFEKSQDKTLNLNGMGSTMVTAFFHNERLYIGNVGDSRAYLFQKNKLWQLTEDHSWVNEQIKQGLVQEEDKKTVPGKNLITRCIGLEKEVNVDIVERVMMNQDRVLLCSDGLTGLVSDEKIAEICQKRPLKKVVEACVKEANNEGGSDNISVIVIDFYT